jgi:hypothetical protein
MKKLIAILFVAILATGVTFAQNSISSTGKFTAEVICQHLLSGDAETQFLGTYIVGQDYGTAGTGTFPAGDADGDDLTFVLTGADGYTYNVYCTFDGIGDDNSVDADLDFEWTDPNGAVGQNIALDWTDALVGVQTGDCLGTATFVIQATGIAVGSGVAHGTTLEYSVEVFADLILI